MASSPDWRSKEIEYLIKSCQSNAQCCPSMLFASFSLDFICHTRFYRTHERLTKNARKKTAENWEKCVCFFRFVWCSLFLLFFYSLRAVHNTHTHTTKKQKQSKFICALTAFCRIFFFIASHLFVSSSVRSLCVCFLLFCFVFIVWPNICQKFIHA